MKRFRDKFHKFHYEHILMQIFSYVFKYSVSSFPFLLSFSSSMILECLSSSSPPFFSSFFLFFSFFVYYFFNTFSFSLFQLLIFIFFFFIPFFFLFLFLSFPFVFLPLFQGSEQNQGLTLAHCQLKSKVTSKLFGNNLSNFHKRLV